MKHVRGPTVDLLLAVEHGTDDYPVLFEGDGTTEELVGDGILGYQLLLEDPLQSGANIDMNRSGSGATLLIRGSYKGRSSPKRHRPGKVVVVRNAVLRQNLRLDGTIRLGLGALKGQTHQQEPNCHGEHRRLLNHDFHSLPPNGLWAFAESSERAPDIQGIDDGIRIEIAAFMVPPPEAEQAADQHAARGVRLV